MIQLYNADCLDILPTIPDKSIDMIICDLPYGTTACKWDVIIPLDQLWMQYKRIIKDKGCIALFGSEPFSSTLRMSNLKDYKYDWIWDKHLAGNSILAKIQPMKIHEIISIFHAGKYMPLMRKGKLRSKGMKSTRNAICNSDGYNTLKINDQYYPVSILDYSNADRKGRLHPTQKPVPLLEYLINTYTLEGQTVLDNCMGSGSTGVACTNTNRDFIGIEKDNKYFLIAKDRIESTTTTRTR